MVQFAPDSQQVRLWRGTPWAAWELVNDHAAPSFFEDQQEEHPGRRHDGDQDRKQCGMMFLSQARQGWQSACCARLGGDAQGATRPLSRRRRLSEECRTLEAARNA